MTPSKPGQAEWNRVYAAKQKGLEAMNEAESTKATDFDRKRKAYDRAIAAFHESLDALKTWRTCEGVDPATADQQDQEIRMFLKGCQKSRPMGN